MSNAILDQADLRGAALVNVKTGGISLDGAATAGLVLEGTTLPL